MTMMTDQDTDRKQESQMAHSKVRGTRKRPTQATTSEENVEETVATAKKRTKRIEDPESVTPTRMQSLRARLGPSGGYAAWLVTSAALTAAVLLALYMAVVWVGTQMVPAAMTLTATFLGTPLATLSMETALAYWVAPNIFIIIVMAGIMLWIVRAVWAWRSRTTARLRTFFLGGSEQERGSAVPPMGKAVLRSSKDSKRLKNEENN